jgi:hypothetical protein
MKLAKFILFLAFSCQLQAEEVEVSQLWHKIEGGAKQRIWLIANEEASFIKAKIGQWLPAAVIGTNNDKSFLWAISKLERNNSRIFIRLLVDTGDSKKAYEISYFDKGLNGPVPVIVRGNESETRITVTCGDGTTRDVIIGSAENLIDLKAKYVVSKAMPLWDWEKSEVIKAVGNW